jgi:hypothetical protein
MKGCGPTNSRESGAEKDLALNHDSEPDDAIACINRDHGYVFNLWQTRHPGPTVRSLRVLPFVNAGGDRDWDYIADGVTESMINRLSRIRDPIVMSRSAVFRIEKTEADASSWAVACTWTRCSRDPFATFQITWRLASS